MSEQIVRAASGNGKAFGCLFCRTGNEKRIAQTIERELPEVRLIFAEKMRRRRYGHRYEEESVLLFPGYLFFCADADFEAQRLAGKPDVYRLLHASDGAWQLHGSDEAFARSLFEQNGVIGFSKAYYEGERIRVVDGILKEYEGKILRVNRRAQTAQICVGMCGREVTIWLGFELMNPQ